MTEDVITSSVEGWVSRVAGQAVAEVTELAGSVANRDYRVRLIDGSCLVVKVGPASELATETWACRRLEQIGLPVPRVAHVDLVDGVAGRPTLALGFLPGEPVEPGEPDEFGAVMRQAGRMFRRVHAEHLDGWGSIVADPSGRSARGRHHTWSDAVHDQLAGLPALIAARILDPALAAAARDQVLTPAVTGYDGPGVLLHNDLKPAHLFAVPGSGAWQLSGIIDWGDATVGDPLVDVARLSMSGSEALRAFSEGYGIDLTPDVLDVLARHRIAWNVSALTYEHRAGGDWFHVYRQRILDDLGLLIDTKVPLDAGSNPSDHR